MRKVNITLDCVSDEQAYFLEQFLSDNYDNVSMQYLPDTKDLYDKSPNFRKMIKAKKTINKEINDYINEYNFK